MRSVASTNESPDARFELATNGLTVHCSTAELIRIGGFIVQKRAFFCNSEISKKNKLKTF